MSKESRQQIWVSQMLRLRVLRADNHRAVIRVEDHRLGQTLDYGLAGHARIVSEA